MKIYEGLGKYINNSKLNKKGLTKGIASIVILVVAVTGAIGCSNNDELMEMLSQQTALIEQQNEQMSVLESRLEQVSNQITDTPSGPQWGQNDTFTAADFDALVDTARDLFDGRFNTMIDRDLRMSLIALNIQYLNAAAEDVMITQFYPGQDIQTSVLNPTYSLMSHIREWNLEIDDINNFMSMKDLFLCDRDIDIIEALEVYYKEAIVLAQNPTTENNRRYNEIFDMISAWIKGEGTIRVNGNDVSYMDRNVGPTFGGMLAIETTIVNGISTKGVNIVPEEDRDELNQLLTGYSFLGRTREIFAAWKAVGTFVSPEITQEATDAIIAQFYFQLDALKNDFARAGISESELHDLLVIANASFFMGGENNNAAFARLFENGFYYEEMLESVRASIEKIYNFNDLNASNPIDLPSLIIYDENNPQRAINDLIIMDGVVQETMIVAHANQASAADAVLNLKGFAQFSHRVVVSVDVEDENGNITSLDLTRNDLSIGAHKITNIWLYNSVKSELETYGSYADAIRDLVNDSQEGLNYAMILGHAFGELCVNTNTPEGNKTYTR